MDAALTELAGWQARALARMDAGYGGQCLPLATYLSDRVIGHVRRRLWQCWSPAQVEALFREARGML